MAKGMGRRPKVDLDSSVEDATLLILERDATANDSRRMPGCSRVIPHGLRADQVPL
ncbi:hypothetical protein OG533_38825 [Streptomyces sp. NBC_01186]|uniref:hypothetical protein n=1 Tax=Streptomyces sp. NBC_01186 TaxID=2903765 RepID=UPI002E0EC18B|nr:hypothetical protein OG533_38825 [Streptomyces sp. NBC_01186]